MSALPITALIEETFTTAPARPVATMRATTYFVQRNVPLTLTAKTASYSSGVASWVGLALPVMPALLTSTSIAPNSFSTRPTAASTAAASVMSKA